MRRLPLVLSALCLLPAGSAVAAADDGPGYHPYAPAAPGPKHIDLSPTARAAARRIAAPTEQPDMARLGAVMRGEQPAGPDDMAPRTGVAPGWVQRGNVVLPSAIDDGSIAVEPGTIFAVEDIPGNEYPRKHTLYLNFTGGMLHSGSDNSAENISALARTGTYPAFNQGEPKAIAIAQAVQNDFAPFGVTVVYETRPAKVIPYTMQMMGGNWTDVNIDTPAGGVAPGADCGALGQRHVVYTFSSASTVQMANTASQEAGHAYGLDHVIDCNSVMSYCGGGDGSFRDSCSGLCEAQCQGPNTAGCRLTHEMFCGEGQDQQNDVEEMRWLFGTNEPDLEAPTAAIESPVDGEIYEAGTSVAFRAVVDDNYGGYGWLVRVEHDGEIILDEPRYEREIDTDYRAALNFGGLAEGSYTVTIEVHDHFGNVATDTVSFEVGLAGEAGGGEDGDGTGTDPSAGDGDDTDADDSGSGGAGTDSLGGTGEDGSDPSGCACAAAAQPAGSAAWALAIFGGVLLGRRRGRPAARSRIAPHGSTPASRLA